MTKRLVAQHVRKGLVERRVERVKQESRLGVHLESICTLRTFAVSWLYRCGRSSLRTRLMGAFPTWPDLISDGSSPRKLSTSPNTPSMFFL